MHDERNTESLEAEAAMHRKRRVLIVDDEDNIRRLLAYSLGKAGYDVEEAKNGAEAVEAALRILPDLIVLDIMMPVMDGNEVVMRLKSDPMTEAVPIIMLTAKASDADKVKGLDIGADDYITKPFSVNELMARVRALLRRSDASKEVKGEGRALKLGPVSIDTAARLSYVDGKKLELTMKEYELLAFLAKNAGTAFSREKLLEEVWGPDYYGDMRTVDVHITHIRAKLGKEASGAIETVRGVGYRANKEKQP